MKKHAIILLACGWLVHLEANAQSVGPSTLNAMGNHGTIGGNTYEWAVGTIPLVNTGSSSSIVITQAVLQPFYPVGIGAVPIANGDLNVYPNPAQDVVFVQPAFRQGGKLQLRLMDITGKLISQQIAILPTGKEIQEIKLGQIAAGQYMLQVNYETQGEPMYQVFKIQKLN